jgi:hypothetical protein
MRPKKEYVRDYIEMEHGGKGEGEKFLKFLDEDFIEVCRAISFVKSEFVDFSDFDMCSFPNLKVVNLHRTPNNFDEQNYPCFKRDGDFSFYRRITN